jgi:polyvinyl alcohol dehydrogenase (cytochrome)
MRQRQPSRLNRFAASSLCRRLRLLLPMAIAFAPLAISAQTAEPQLMRQGTDVYRAHCAVCHDHPEGRIPSLPRLQQSRSADYVVRTLTVGAMRQQGSGLKADQIRAVATYLMGRAPGSASEVDPNANHCQGQAPALSLTGSVWNGWGGRGVNNARFQPDPGIALADVSRLKLKWVFAYPAGPSSQPTIIGERIFVPSMSGIVFALDARTGCTYWSHDLGVPSRSAISVARLTRDKIVLFLGDSQGDAHALDADSGAELWRQHVGTHPAARVTGAPTYFNGRLYVPVASLEETEAGDPSYVCCTFRGSVAALDAATGRILWRHYTIAQAPKALRGDPHRMGPAGAGIWSSPTVDPKRHLLYVATGNAYTEPPAAESDAIVALDLATGERRWVRQVNAHDAWISGCGSQSQPNCPQSDFGTDADFGGSPMLVTTASGQDVLVDGSKAGIVYGLDPDHDGKLVWQLRVGHGGVLGGVEWGGAATGERAYFAINDLGLSAVGQSPDPESSPMPGLNAISIIGGALLWHSASPHGQCSWSGACSNGEPAAPLAITGAVFAGSSDGHERAYDAADGKVLWDFDTGRSFDAVNAGKASGGSIDQGAQTMASGILLVNSGARFGQTGNALLAFTVDGQ